ncbi:MAG: hypothetical protein M1834_004331 [Cirrosporium novae-zelandiae]|nr:MAG: hypothetical protein M1834_004331 [Cirrosporium novae-zelandiae]
MSTSASTSISVAATPPLTAFISGPVEPSPEYLATYYAPRLLKAISEDHKFVMGPAPGIDREALSFLLLHNVPPENMTVYLTEYESKRNEYRSGPEAVGVNIKVAGITVSERDSEMTRVSDYDILRYRTQEESKALYGAFWTPGHVTETERNERRRIMVKEREREKEKEEEVGEKKKRKWKQM